MAPTQGTEETLGKEEPEDRGEQNGHVGPASGLSF